LIQGPTDDEPVEISQNFGLVFGRQNGSGKSQGADMAEPIPLFQRLRDIALDETSP
jgi:hypothetical protein